MTDACLAAFWVAAYAAAHLVDLALRLEQCRLGSCATCSRALRLVGAR